MSTSTTQTNETARPKNYFATTHWTMVLAAGRNDTTRARHALAQLCQIYWYPLYAYVRRRGYKAQDTQDLTQEFFARFLERDALAGADPARGRFRSFILTAMNHFLATEWEKARTKKRGGGAEIISLDLAAAEKRYDLEPADLATPDKAFDHQWALALLNLVLNRLEDDYQRDGKIELFTSLKQTLMGSRESQPYRELAASVGMNEGALKVAVHRLRRRYRDLLQAEIAHTVTSTAEAGDELLHLFAVLTGH